MGANAMNLMRKVRKPRIIASQIWNWGGLKGLIKEGETKRKN